jgi:hypothetical protein
MDIDRTSGPGFMRLFLPILVDIVSCQISTLKEGSWLDHSQRRRMILFSADQKMRPMFR